MRPLALALAVAASAVNAQAAPNNNLALIGYNALKTRVKPTGELAAQVASIDSSIRSATQRGESAEVRHLIAKATALLNNRQWTDADDYRASLVLRTDHLVVDPTAPYVVRLEQTYAPSIVLAPNLTATASILSAANAAPGSPPAAKTLRTLTDVPRDLRDQPLRVELDLAGTPDGDYGVQVSIADSARPLGLARLRISVVTGLDARLKALDAAATKAPVDLKADIAYPGDYIHKVDRGIIPLGTFNVTAELASAESLAVAVAGRERTGPRNARAAENPVAVARSAENAVAVARSAENAFSMRTGRFERHYVLEAAAEIMPYGVYVPKKYDAKTAMPLIIALHGAGGTEASFMTSYSGLMPQLAEQHGYIVAAPMGYRVDGFYGSTIMNRGKDSELSEQDVMQVLALMKKNYKIDEHRIYLMGHSMGGIGTWFLGPKYPDIWAALGVFSGIGVPASVERIKTIPEFVVHGDADNTVNVQYSRAMVAELQRLGVDYKYIEVPGGDHNGVVVPNLAAMFDFFDLKKKP